jgi:hypothetical protein
MSDRSKRVLWLIQHKTLMKAEVPILRSLGFEVYVPKIFTPAEHHRSSGVSFDYDDSLTIPPHVLEALNATDFYVDGALSDEVIEYINEYFGAAFFIALEALHVNMLRHYRGPLIMRAFGVVEPQTYLKALWLWGGDAVELVDAARDRFWFGACYPPLAEVEPPLLAERNVYLPLALPDSFGEAHADTWTGRERQILFVCPDINLEPTSRATYEHFKRVYGDLPHVIVGRQFVPVDDPHVRGFVTNEELVELMQTSSVMIYTSHEPRMMQYPPVEAAVIGLPVIFYRDSLLGSLLPHPPRGGIADDREARHLVDLILGGDAATIDGIRADQRGIAEVFSEDWCQRIWSENLRSSGILAAIDAPHGSEGLESLDTLDPDWFVARERLLVPDQPVDSTPLEQGIAMNRVNLSDRLVGTHGLGNAEDWGRWVHDTTAVFRLAEPVSGSLELEIVGGAVGPVFHKPIRVRLGDADGILYLSEWILPGTRARVPLRVNEPATLLTITAPEIEVSAGRVPISIGIGRLRLRRRPSLPYRVARRGAEVLLRASRRLRARTDRD